MEYNCTIITTIATIPLNPTLDPAASSVSNSFRIELRMWSISLNGLGSRPSRVYRV